MSTRALAPNTHMTDRQDSPDFSLRKHGIPSPILSTPRCSSQCHGTQCRDGLFFKQKLTTYLRISCRQQHQPNPLSLYKLYERNICLLQNNVTRRRYSLTSHPLLGNGKLNAFPRQRTRKQQQRKCSKQCFLPRPYYGYIRRTNVREA
jgi:hypothetical protein